METILKKLGKVAITVDKYLWSSEKEYDKLVIVRVDDSGKSYLSRKQVPAGTSINNEEYWFPFVKDAVKGDSAYEVAVHNGYEGTEEEWIESLHVSQEDIDALHHELQQGLSVLEDKADKDNTYTKTVVDAKLDELRNLIPDENSSIVVVDSVESITDPQPNTIYRVKGVSSYADYGYNGTTLVKLAQYDNATDDTPEKNSENLVKSGGVFNAVKEVDDSVLSVIKDTSYKLQSAATVLGSEVSMTGYEIDVVSGVYKVKTISDNAYTVTYFPIKAKKGTILRLTGRSTASRKQTMCYMTTDPAEVTTWNNTVVNLISTKSKTGFWAEEYTIPEDGWFIYYIYNQNWQNRTWTVYTPDVESITDKVVVGKKDYSYTAVWQSGGTTDARQAYCPITTNELGQTVITIANNGSGGWFGATISSLPVGKYEIEIDYEVENGVGLQRCSFYTSNSDNTVLSGNAHNTRGTIIIKNGKFVVPFTHDRNTTFYLAFFGQDYVANQVITITDFKITRLVTNLDNAVTLLDPYYMRWSAPYTEINKIIDGREGTNFGKAIDVDSSYHLACTGFIPTMGVSRIRLYVQETSATEGIAEVKSVVGYNANKEPITLIHMTQLGESTTSRLLTFDVPSDVEYIRFSAATNTWLNSNQIEYYDDPGNFRTKTINGTLLQRSSEVVALTSTKAISIVEGSNYGQRVTSPKAALKCIKDDIDVSGLDYIAISSRITCITSESFTNYGCVFLDSDGVVIEVCQKIVTTYSNLDAYSGICIYKVPENAVTFRGTVYSSSATTTTIYKFRAQNRNTATVDINRILKSVREEEYLHKIRQAKYKDTSNSSPVDGRPVVPAFGLLHISDFHEDIEAGELLLHYKNLYSSYINDLVCTGDVVKNYLDSNGAAPLAYLDSGLADEALFVLGNHDQANETGRNENYWANAKGNGDVAASHAFSHDRYFVGKKTDESVVDIPLYTKWGVTMPSGHDDSTKPEYNACYWHKDYADHKIRVIGLDCMYRFDGVADTSYTVENNLLVYNKTNDLLDIISGGMAHNTTDQETWLINRLNDTLNPSNPAYGYSVIFLCHYPLDDIAGFNTLTNRANVGQNGGYVLNHMTNWPVRFNMQLADESWEAEYRFNMRNRTTASSPYDKGDKNNIGDIIENWRVNGGRYVAWICGHTHNDKFYYPQKYPELLTVVIDQAGALRDHTLTSRPSGTDDKLCANYYAIDTHSGYFKIVRLGLTSNRQLRERHTLCYNYLTKTVISEE